MSNQRNKSTKTMKTFLKAVILAGLLFAVPGWAAVGDVAFSATGTAVSTNVSYAIVPVPPGGGQAKVTSLAGVTDNSTKGFVWCTVGNAYAINTTSATTTNEFRLDNSGSLLASNDIVILYQPAAGTYTRLYVTNATATNIICNSASPAALAVGDVIWEATAANEYTLTTGTPTAINGYGGILYGQQGRPLMVEVRGIGTNTVKLFWLSAEYYNPRYLNPPR